MSKDPRPNESRARREQLERLKHKRKAARETRRHVAKEHQEVSAPAVTYAQLLAEIRRIAMAGVMPTPARFDYAKPTTWATADEFCARFATSWQELGSEAGLKVSRAVTA